MKNKWTLEELELLYKIYPNEKTDTVKKSFNRTWDAIKLKANSLKIKRDIVDIRIGDINILLKDIQETYYWLGFIMADGCILHDTYRLKIGLSYKDYDHLEKFCKFTNCKLNDNLYKKSKYKNCYVSIQDKIVIKELIKKFNFLSNKTINPPTNIINNMPDDLALSFIIGFIDGDGCIKKVYKRKDSILTIKNHSTWIHFLNDIKNKLEYLLNTEIKPPRINTAGYAFFNITNIKTLRELKNKVKKLNVPYMKRKWDIIDEFMISKYETTNKNREKIKELFDMGMKQIDISKHLNISKSVVSKNLKIIFNI